MQSDENKYINKQQLLEGLKEIIDPELDVNIVDLGLVYNVLYDEPTKEIKVLMTLSSPGCPLGDAIAAQVESKLTELKPGADVVVEIVWEPMWTPSMISREGKMMLGII